ncbi:MAG: diphosphomevalonate decarboxylase [Saprospiraceae bacterium]|jgi:diphosphomevalonate decarboxylase|nr:diphosphomevalonate decarboxylase [Saprospiraceae bacterium]MBL0023675.1 diphosphomevalonate decarboxylase [Saprospiraceae bacterium]
MSNLTESLKNNIKTGWESPSNIALVKYWGKYDNQLPQNPSVSFTLSTAATRTFVTYSESNHEGMDVSFLFDGHENAPFKSRIEKFLNQMSSEYFPFLKNGHIAIETSNSFPHSSGIASSASAMSALALCLCDIENSLNGNTTFSDAFFRKASFISRLASGSACRSVFPLMAVWGLVPTVAGSSEEWAIGFSEDIHPVFHNFHDDILIISPNEKSVSSSAGHQLMENNPYAPARYTQAGDRLKTLLVAIRDGDIDTFGKITEAEALTLHALMMCSDPAYILMEEGSLTVIKKIQKFRVETGIPVWFTLDAGPNVHVLYPADADQQVQSFIISELKPYCHEGKIIRDKVGTGPKKIS